MIGLGIQYVTIIYKDINTNLENSFIKIKTNSTK